MRLQGKITRWDDERGFGFISWHGDGSTVFVHIKAFSRTARRPVVGDIVSYQVTKDKQGKPRAEKALFADQQRGKTQSTRNRQSGKLPVVFTPLFLCFLVVSAFFSRISWLVVAVYFVASLVTFLVYAWDKSSARRGDWRTAESSLHIMGLIGGWPGALAAQRLHRHKSSKREFLSVFWFTVFLNVLAAGYLVWSGDASSINQLIDNLWQKAIQ